jgi:hypothetical protein
MAYENEVAAIELVRAVYKDILLESDQALPSFRFILCRTSFILLQGNNPAIYVNKDTVKKVQKWSTTFDAAVYTPGPTPSLTEKTMSAGEIKHQDILINLASFKLDTTYNAFRTHMILAHEMAHGEMEDTFGYTMEQDAYAMELGLILGLCTPEKETAAGLMGMNQSTAAKYLTERSSQYSTISKPTGELWWFYTHTLPFYDTIAAWTRSLSIPPLKMPKDDTLLKASAALEAQLKAGLGLGDGKLDPDVYGSILQGTLSDEVQIADALSPGPGIVETKVYRNLLERPWRGLVPGDAGHGGADHGRWYRCSCDAIILLGA